MDIRLLCGRRLATSLSEPALPSVSKDSGNHQCMPKGAADTGEAFFFFVIKALEYVSNATSVPQMSPGRDLMMQTIFLCKQRHVQLSGCKVRLNVASAPRDVCCSLQKLGDWSALALGRSFCSMAPHGHRMAATAPGTASALLRPEARASPARAITSLS